MSVYVSVDLQRQVRAYFADCCAYCRTQEVLTATTFEFEHIIPHSAGGQTAFENLCLSCPSCNRHKAHRQTAIDPITNETVALFHPHRQEWEEHFDWSEDRTEILGLSPTGRATISALKMNRPQLVRVRRMWVKMGEHPPELDQ
jgi:HNH endonuclease